MGEKNTNTQAHLEAMSLLDLLSKHQLYENEMEFNFTFICIFYYIHALC